MATTVTMAGPQFDALPYEEGRRWELLDGDLIAVSSPTPEHQLILSNLNASLREYFRRVPIGAALPDVEFALGENDRVRPDLAVLLHQRWRSLDLRRTPVPGAPDIAIEIISPSERPAESTRKVWVYLRSGVEEVWQVYAPSRTVAVYTVQEPLRVWNQDEALRSALLPEWQMAVREIFLA